CRAPKSGTYGQTRHISRGPLLPAEGFSDRGACSAATDRGYSETGPAFQCALRTTNEQENRAHPSGDNGSAGAVPLAGKGSGTAKLYRTGSDSFSSFGIRRSGIGTGAVRLTDPAQYAGQRSCGGGKGSHSPSTGSEQLGDRRPYWRGGTTRHEANLFGIQNEQAPHKSSGCLSRQN